MEEELERVSLIFNYGESGRWQYFNIKKDTTNSNLLQFGRIINSLQEDIAKNFTKEERFLLNKN